MDLHLAEVLVVAEGGLRFRVVRKFLTVVGGHYDDGVVEQPLDLELAQQPSDGGVEKKRRRIVMRYQLTYALFHWYFTA